MKARRWPVVVVFVSAVWGPGCEGSDSGATDTSVTTDPSFADASDDVALAVEVAADTGPPAPTEIALGEPRLVVPSSGLPPEAPLQDANNNLDVVEHGGRVFLAWRTAPMHWASPDARLHVASSVDEVSWSFETSVFRETDLREPRFLSWSGRLFLFFAVLGKDIAAFEPEGAMLTEYLGPGEWTEPEWVLPDGMIPWRTKVVDGKPYMTGYIGGENIYQGEASGLLVQWLTTTDGRNWTGVVPNVPVVSTGGGSESDFALLEDGRVVAVIRNEAGDELGFGSKICKAPADDPGDWRCVGDPKKYDSPLVFAHRDQVWLIARRNVTEDGHYDLGSEGTHAERSLEYQLAYWKTPKRCALWRVDPDKREVTWELDLPSRGDTCFAGILKLDAHRYAVYNYTSPLDGDEDLSWFDGQAGPTHVYRIELTLP